MTNPLDLSAAFSKLLGEKQQQIPLRPEEDSLMLKKQAASKRLKRSPAGAMSQDQDMSKRASQSFLETLKTDKGLQQGLLGAVQGAVTAEAKRRQQEFALDKLKAEGISQIEGNLADRQQRALASLASNLSASFLR